MPAHPAPAPSPTTRRRVRRGLLDWYATEHREFPWRGTDDPYAVLVSEVMLQQTQASRIAERFPRFMAHFPTLGSLASAPAADVIAEWSGLGYNRRALALQRTAVIIARDGWPSDLAGLARLPGIGPYTARAVASLAFGTPVGVVDTNVRRWLLRRFGGPDDPRRLQLISDGLAAPGRGGPVAAWTHAKMEFGAAIRRSRQPRCSACPSAAGCPSRGSATVVPLPRQPSLRGSDRAYRGATLRFLSASNGLALRERQLLVELARAERRIGQALDQAGWARVMSGLERDGLAHRSGGMVRLGAATIGP
ncbi:A/G-specific adenine glycosylase [soil metagenome]